jgi:hypothetical protein
MAVQITVRAHMAASANPAMRMAIGEDCGSSQSQPKTRAGT